MSVILAPERELTDIRIFTEDEDMEKEILCEPIQNPYCNEYLVWFFLNKISFNKDLCFSIKTKIDGFGDWSYISLEENDEVTVYLFDNRQKIVYFGNCDSEDNIKFKHQWSNIYNFLESGVYKILIKINDNFVKEYNLHNFIKK